MGPQEAKKILDKARDQRPRRSGWIRDLADLMRRGQFVSTHQGIAIDSEGYLIDGQHRLLAVIESGVTIGILVTRGLDKSSYRSIDSGLARTMGDRLKLLSDPKANQIACALVRSYIVATQVKSASRVAVDLIDNTFLPLADEFTEVAERFRRPVPGITRSDIGAALVCYLSKHPQQASEFIEGYITGEGMRKGEPAMALREAVFMRRVAYGSIHTAYWKTIFTTQQHHEGATGMTRVQTAIKDWRGNVFERAHYDRVRRSEKAAKTVIARNVLSRRTADQIKSMRAEGA